MVDRELFENNRQTGLYEFEEPEQGHDRTDEKPEPPEPAEVGVDSKEDKIDEETGSEESDQETSPSTPLKLRDLPTTDSGSVKKADAMDWLADLDQPSNTGLKHSFVPKPRGFSGSTFPAAVSTIRITGEPEFIESVAGLLKPVLDLEAETTRLEIGLQRVEDRDTGEMTDNYALYLSVAERGT